MFCTILISKKYKISKIVVYRFKIQSPLFFSLSPLYFSQSPLYFSQSPHYFSCGWTNADHATPPHPLLPSTMNEHEVGGQALSLYHCYIERGYPVSLQLWSTQDGGQHCKFSCPPIQHLCPSTQLIKPHKPHKNHLSTSP